MRKYYILNICIIIFILLFLVVFHIFQFVVSLKTIIKSLLTIGNQENTYMYKFIN